MSPRETPSDAGGRRGICCAGNWIIDHLKTVDVWPAEETLATILSEESGGGGAAYNVSVDLSRFEFDIPVAGIGLVGEDADGERVLAECRERGIDARHIRRVAGVSTAYTDVMAVRGTGRRTFFHHRGANALLGPEHVPLDGLPSRLLTLGYLLLLDALDGEDAEYGTRAARVLAGARERGIATAVDVVSEDSDRFRRVVTPALPHTDHLVVNEIEAGRTTGRELRPGGELDRAEVEAAARDLLEAGVRQRVVIHAAEGAYGRTPEGESAWRPGHDPPEGFIRGTVGAGDAFFAGHAVGVHEGWGLEESLAFANAAAASCLRHPTCTGGVGTADEVRALARELPLGMLR